jgi:peroxiredoxin
MTAVALPLYAAPVPQDPEQPATLKVQPIQVPARPSKQEIDAAKAWQALQGSFKGPKDSTREAFDKYLDEVFKDMESFAIHHAGTAASFEARHELALMDIHAREQSKQGLARMAAIHQELKTYKGVVPEGLRLDLARYTFVYALALADEKHFLKAETLLHPVIGSESPDAGQAKKILERIQVRKHLQVGMIMPDFGGTRLRGGEKMTLSKLKGEVVLIQFWATWSRPCNQELPLIAEVYHKLNQKGFTILGVAMDDDRQGGHSKLTKYLEDQNMPWPQLYDGKGWESSPATRFHVRSIPANFLLDQNGVIRNTNLRAGELQAAVELLLAPKAVEPIK